MKVIKKILILSTILLLPLTIQINSVSGIDYKKIENNIKILHKKNGDNFLEKILNTIKKIEDKKNLDGKKKEILEKIKEIIEKEKKFSIKKDDKKINSEKIQENSDKINEEINKKRIDFYNKYAKNIISKNPISPLCIKKYDLIDKIAKKNDFPTELIIATWGMEHSCIFANPSNFNGNFQIITRVYKPGKITDKQFEVQIQDFINFSKEKWKFYERYKKLAPGTIKLKYNDYDLDSIRYHAAAYNGVGNHLTESKYINGNLNSKVPYKKDGIVTRFLKVLDWEIKNKKTGNTYGEKGRSFKSSKNSLSPKKEFDSITYKKIGENSYKVFGTTNGKLKYIKVLWLNGGEKEVPYKLQTYYLGKKFFAYTIKPKYENITKGINKYKFFGEDKSGKYFEKILVIKN